MAINKIEAEFLWNLDSRTHFLIPLGGAIHLDQNPLGKGEFLKAEGIQELLIAPFQSKFAHVLQVSVG